jgi:hypothetical protein
VGGEGGGCIFKSESLLLFMTGEIYERKFRIFIFEQCIPVVFINNHKYKCIFGIYSLTQLAKVSLKVFITL